MSTLPVAGHISDNARTEGEVKADLDAMVAVMRELPGGEAETELTIASGSINPTRAAHSVDTESDAATDDLTTIAQTNHPDGRIVLIRAENASRVVTLKHAAGGAGQMFLSDDQDLALGDTEAYILLKRRGTAWYEVMRSSVLQQAFPAGTKMLFQQTTAPAGWTKLLTDDNKALRVVTGTAGSGGGDNFTTVFGSGKSTASHVLTISEMPSHTHNISTYKDSGGPTNRVRGIHTAVSYGTAVTQATGGGGAHSHNLTMDLQYIDVIVASKN